MAKEIEWQRKICKRVKVGGGLAYKWATQYSVGVPDTIMTIPGFMGVNVDNTVLMEFKKENKCKPGMARGVKLTLKQSEVLKECHKAGGNPMVAVVFEVNVREVYIAFAPFVPDVPIQAVWSVMLPRITVGGNKAPHAMRWTPNFDACARIRLSSQSR